MIKSIFLKIILIIMLISGFNKVSASSEGFGEFASRATEAGIFTAIPALVFLTIPHIRNKINYGKFFAKRPGKLRFDPDTLAQIFIGFPLGAISIASLGVAAISKFGEYGIKNLLFSSAQFFGGLSGISTLLALLSAKKWYDYQNHPRVKELEKLKAEIKKRKESKNVQLSPERTRILKEQAYKLETKIALELPEYNRFLSSKTKFIISSLATTIFAISALKSR